MAASNNPVGAHVGSLGEATQADDKTGKFVIATFGAGFLATAALALWVLQTGTFGYREIALTVTAILPVFIAAFVAKTKCLKHGQTLMTGVVAAGITLAGTVMPQWSAITPLLLALVPLLAVTHQARKSVLGAAFLAFVGFAIVTSSAMVTDPLKIATNGGFLVLTTLFCLFTKLQLERLRSKVAAGQGLLQQFALSQSDLVTRHDSGGLTLFASNVSSRLLGVEPNALLNLGLHDKIHVQDRVAMLKAISDAASTFEDQTCEFRIRSKAGAAQGWKWVAMQCVPERDEITGAIIVNATTRDVGTLKQQSEQLFTAGQTVNQVQEKQRILLKDLREQVQVPTTALAQKCAALDEKDARQAFVAMSALQLQKAVDGLVDTTALELGETSVSLSRFQVMNPIGTSIKAVQADLAAAGITVLSDVPANIPDMHSDKAIVTRMFDNILSTAISSAGPVSSIAIKARRHGNCIRFDIECKGTQASTEPAIEHSIIKGLVAVLGGTFEQSKRSANCIFVSITLPVNARATAPTSTKTKPTIHEQTSEGETRARLSA